MYTWTHARHTCTHACARTHTHARLCGLPVQRCSGAQWKEISIPFHMCIGHCYVLTMGPALCLCAPHTNVHTHTLAVHVVCIHNILCTYVQHINSPTHNPRGGALGVELWGWSSGGGVLGWSSGGGALGREGLNAFLSATKCGQWHSFPDRSTLQFHNFT